MEKMFKRLMNKICLCRYYGHILDSRKDSVTRLSQVSLVFDITRFFGLKEENGYDVRNTRIIILIITVIFDLMTICKVLKFYYMSWPSLNKHYRQLRQKSTR